MNSYNLICSTLRNGVRLIQLNRADHKNAFTISMYLKITEILQEDTTNDSVVLTIITGKGEYFTSGHDFKPPLSEVTADDQLEILEKFIGAFIDYPKLLIGVVNGFSIGIGTTILALCDIVYASDRARFWTPFVHLGICPEGTSTYTFPRILGRSKASELLLLGEKMSVQEAYARGFVSKIIPHDNLENFIDGLQKYGELPVSIVKSAKNLLLETIKDQLHATNKQEIDGIRKMTASKNSEYEMAKKSFIPALSKL